ncbi:aminoglycoside phosphotransferase family protein [Zafaria sp. Z1313]|uniref:aminoglycoside phosphotransferase family protein n=1 Tax=unclassified Zafaria TaxID=2828765 RepID=UPI002E7A44FF|nr:aminoglycoside phosphotransferase family protein [Zafaria sp. J156]MEE1620013.1 aminoglycoside phosphotransferase family protein [Zafaria sp. J156]
MGTPEADVEITESLVGALLRAQHPDLAALPLGPAASGWDNAVYRLGDALAVRLPRRASAHRLLLNEVRWLPFLAPRLPLPVPAAVRRGRPGEGYPYHWAVVPWFAGCAAGLVPPHRRDAYAEDLAGFFRCLQVPAPADAPRNPVRAVPLADRDDAFRERLRRAAPGVDRQRCGRLWEDGLDAPPHTGPAVWVHGDPHPMNVVLGAGERLAAVADFGDLSAGDPACDLAAGWLHFTSAGRERFLSALADDDGARQRARAWAVMMGLVLASTGPGEALHGVGMHALRELGAA